jgi:2-(1,2-epoxy-1,2-dihydrophenyl)acetyl-CoA isomerase
MTESAPVVAYEVAFGVAHVELNRPESFNALDITLARSLRDVVAKAAADDEVKVVLLSGRGRAFCAGGDLTMMASAESVSVEVHELATEAHQAILALAQLSKPVVAIVHGSVAGGGVGLSCAADLMLAGESTRLVAAYPGIAVTPDCSLSWALPRIIGERRALEFMLLNKPISAATAVTWGLVTEVHPDDKVHAAGIGLARALAAGPAAAALGKTRRLVRDSADRTLADQLDVEAASISDLAATPGSKELVRTFVKR